MRDASHRRIGNACYKDAVSIPSMDVMHRSTMAHRLAALAALTGVLAGAAVAHAQDTSRPLTFDVRPSRAEPETEDEKLERRLKRAEFLFRSICTHCGPASAAPSSAPFRPHEALGRRTPSALD
jgi:hypothetical protein